MSEEPGALQSRCQGSWAGREQSSTPGHSTTLNDKDRCFPGIRATGAETADARQIDWEELGRWASLTTQPTCGCSQWVQENPSTRHSLVWGLQTQGSLGPKKLEVQLGERGAGGSMCSVTQLCPTVRDPTDCSSPASSVHGIFPSKHTRSFSEIWVGMKEDRTYKKEELKWRTKTQRETWPNPEWNYCCWEAGLRVWAGSWEQGQRSCHRYGDAQAGSDASADHSGLQGLLSEALEHILETQAESWRLGT